MKLNTDMMTQRLLKIRTARRLTQEEVSNRAGIAPNYYANIENGSRTPSLEVFVAVAKALQVDANYLLFESLDVLNMNEAPVQEGGRYFFLQPHAEMDIPTTK